MNENADLGFRGNCSAAGAARRPLPAGRRMTLLLLRPTGGALSHFLPSVAFVCLGNRGGRRAGKKPEIVARVLRSFRPNPRSDLTYFRFMHF